VPLAELGTHCRGALFLDGAERITPALEEATEACSRGFPGFYFGRYDVRAESVEAFQAGRFQILELNGLTSEATSIYDPRHGLLHAWTVLARQWAWAFAIGAENARRGARVLTWQRSVGPGPRPPRTRTTRTPVVRAGASRPAGRPGV
jgi:hypothetical protein